LDHHLWNCQLASSLASKSQGSETKPVVAASDSQTHSAQRCSHLSGCPHRTSLSPCAAAAASGASPGWCCWATQLKRQGCRERSWLPWSAGFALHCSKDQRVRPSLTYVEPRGQGWAEQDPREGLKQQQQQGGQAGRQTKQKGKWWKKKKPIWPRVHPKPRPKGYRKKPLWPRVYPKPRQKGTLWLRFLTEAKSYDLLASPQYASVPEPVQNIKNNRCQRPFLHWWM